MKKILIALLVLVPGLAAAQGFSMQGTVNTAREYSADLVSIPAWSFSAGFQPGRHWYFGGRVSNGYDDTETGLALKYGWMGEARYYLTKGFYWGATFGALEMPDEGGIVGPAWSLILFGRREALGHGLYVSTEWSVGNVSPGLAFGLGYCPQYTKREDSKPVEHRFEVEVGFPFFAYAGFRLVKGVGIGVKAESFHKPVKLDGQRIGCKYTSAALQIRYYFLNLGSFSLYSATGGGIANIQPSGKDPRSTWYWDSTLIGGQYRIRNGRFYFLAEVNNGSLAWNCHLGAGLRL